MFIKQLKLKGFRGFEKLTLDFPFYGESGGEKPVPVVLLGLNGSGKTTVLDAIDKLIYTVYAFSKNIDTTKIPDDDININSINCEISLNFDNEKLIAFRSKKNKKIDSQATDNIEIINEIRNQSIVLKYFGTNRMFFSTKDIYKSSSNIYGDAFNNGLTDFKSFLRWFEEKENLENQDKIYKKQLEFTLKDLDVVRSGLNIFLQNLGVTGFDKLRILRKSNGREYDELKEPDVTEKPLYVIDVEVNLAIDKNGQTYKFPQLSHGEQMMILVACDIARRLTIANPKMENPLEGKGIILIDEIELHLHPTWQGKVVNALSATFPNIQFIVTTHSPLVINHVKRESLFMLENFQLQQLNGFNNYGAEVESILRAIQKVDSNKMLPNKVSKLLKKYFIKISEERFEEAKTIKGQLEKIIDSNHPELLRGETLMEMNEFLKS